MRTGESDREASELSCDALASLEGRRALLDVREIGDYEVAHIAGATSLSRGRIEFDARHVVPDLAAKVIVYDAADGRAELARRTLSSMGYQTVLVLKGGLAAWIAAGHPTRCGTNVPSKLFGEQLLHDDRVQEISAEALEAVRSRADAPLVLDIRTRAEHERGCIPGAVHVPGGNLISIAADLRTLGRPIVTHCAGRTRSIVAAATLTRLGVKNVRALRNGTMGWMLAEMRLEVPAAYRSMTPSDLSVGEAAAEAASLREHGNVPSMDARSLIARTTPGSEPLYIFDVRQRDEFDAESIAGSVHAPGGQLVQCADDYIALRDLDIVVVSNHGARATVVTWWLRRMGFLGARVLADGLQAWRLAGGSLEQRAISEASPEVGTPTISAADLEREIATKACVVLDLGTSARFERRHVPGACWISRGSLEMAMPSRLPLRETPVVLTGAPRAEAELAATTIREMGYPDVKILEVSLGQWCAQGRAIGEGLDDCWSEPCDIPYRAILRGDREAMRRYLDWETMLNQAPVPPSPPGTAR